MLSLCNRMNRMLNKQTHTPPTTRPGGSYMLKKRLTTGFPQDHLSFCLFLLPFLGFMASCSSGSTDPLNNRTENCSWSRAGQWCNQGTCSWGCTFTRAGPCMCPFLLTCLQMCQQHTVCQGSTLETLQKLQRQSLVLTVPYVFSLQFFDSRDDFCLIREEEKEGSSL